MSGWIKISIDELIASDNGSIKTGPFGTALKASEYSAEGVPVISVGEVGYGELKLRASTPRVGEHVTSRLSEYVLRAGDIVFGRKGAVDRSAWVKPEQDGWFLGSDGIRLRLPDSVDSRFIGYQMLSATTRDWLLQNASGSTMLSLNQGTLGRVSLVLPSLPEQRAIAEVLGALDDKIAANVTLVAALNEFAITLLGRESAMIPLGRVVKLRRSTVSPDEIREPRVAHFSLPAFDAGQLPVIEAPREIKSAKFYLDAPIVLLSKLNPRFPRVWSVDRVDEYPSLASTEFLVLEPIRAANEVLWAALSQREFSLALDAKVSGTSGSHQRVRPDDALDTPIINPEVANSQLSGEIINVVRLAAQLRRESRSLSDLRDTLLPELISGRLQVKDAEKKIEEVV